MPLPDRLARFNRRVTNPLLRTFAGRLPPFAIVVHRGRRSGREYRTPVMAFRADGDFVVALTYGAERDWVKNVRAQGGCALLRGGRRLALTSPRLVRGAKGLRLVPTLLRPVLRRLGVTEFLRLETAGRQPEGALGRGGGPG